VELGKTSGGIPIIIDRRFVDADLRIVTGLVEPHFMAGYSGGRKVVAPGVAYQDTILNFHTARILEHCKAANCIIEGYPHNKTYYQTIKGMVGVVDILEPEGTIIIASECSEGMGSHEFVSAQRLLCEVGPERFMSILEGRDKALIDEWQTEMLVKALRVGTIQLYTTGLRQEDLLDVFVKPASSLVGAVVDSLKANGHHEIAVVPEGPYVIPLYGKN
jgi:nickel-dependent lactate racemase